MSLKLCFIGAGNLATHLSKALQKKGYSISQVYSKTEVSAKLLADKLNTQWTTSVAELENADVYFVALKDSVVDEVLTQIDFQNKILVHCSGSLPISVLKGYSKNIGVFYPLQTFSKNREVDFSSVPVFIESNSKEIENVLYKVASKITDTVLVLNSEKRKKIHISAVFACNFVNHFYTISSEILNREEIPFEVLKPLILETALKVQDMEPENAQTGPAVRFDENIISTHLKELKGLNDYQELYNSISKSIFEFHKKQD